MLNLQNLNDAKSKILQCDTTLFAGTQNSFKFYLNEIKINNFRHINNLELTFEHPVTIISGTNKVGKTSILLLIACSHYNFRKYDSTKPETLFRIHTWRDVLTLTSYEAATQNYSYELFWRVGTSNRHGEGKRLASSQAWTGIGKHSATTDRVNSKIKDREVRLIDLERLVPARNFSTSLRRKILNATGTRVSSNIEQAFAYIFDISVPLEITKIGSHINKIAYLISYSTGPYSSYNAASGEEALINILVDIFDAPQNSLILIDEIEAGLHPSIQRKVADIIQYVSWHHKKQFILTTHSPSLMATFPQKSRKFINVNFSGQYEIINAISMNAAFSKMDSKAYPLIQLYCEDQEAEFIIKNILVEINKQNNHFDRYINIIVSGAINEVKNDYQRHKRNYNQMKFKIGYACVFDGDYRNEPNYSVFSGVPNEFTYFLYPYTAPEKFLVQSYLRLYHNPSLAAALNMIDHHSLFQEMTNLGLATDRTQARQLCWDAFKTSTEYITLETELTTFLSDTVSHFSRLAD